MHSPLNYELARQLHADALREARRHPLAEIPPKERRASRFGRRLREALTSEPARPLRPAADAR
jgi:hypothetical protein